MPRKPELEPAPNCRRRNGKQPGLALVNIPSAPPAWSLFLLPLGLYSHSHPKEQALTSNTILHLYFIPGKDILKQTFIVLDFVHQLKNQKKKKKWHIVGENVQASPLSKSSWKISWLSIISQKKEEKAFWIPLQTCYLRQHTNVHVKCVEAVMTTGVHHQLLMFSLMFQIQFWYGNHHSTGKGILR